jgi:ATP-binding cassette subfamily G (WHITE) protein 2
MMVVFGLIVGLIYLRLSDDSKGIQNRVGGFFFIIINLVFGNMGTIELFMAERTLYRHEASSGYYHIWAYFLARVIIDLTLVNMLPYMLFSAIVYWMIGFVSNAGKFFYFMVMVVLTALAGNGISYTVGAGVTVYATGSLFVALIYTFMMVFGGLLLNLTSIPIWLRWLQWLSVFRYALEGMSVNELKGALFCDDKNNGTCAITASATGHSEMCQPLITNGTAYLIEQDFDIDNALWYDPLALVLFFIGFLLIAMLELKYCRKNR